MIISQPRYLIHGVRTLWREVCGAWQNRTGFISEIRIFGRDLGYIAQMVSGYLGVPYTGYLEATGLPASAAAIPEMWASILQLATQHC